MKMLVVSNMYPNKKAPFYGVFVQRFCKEIEKINIQYDLSIMHKKSGKVRKIIGYIVFYCKTFCYSLFGRYDLVYIHYASHSSFPILCANKLKKMKIFTNVHGSDIVPENAHQQKMQKYSMRIIEKSEKIIVPSEYFREYVCKKYSLNYSKVYVYPSAGVDDIFYFPHSMEKRLEDIEKFGFSQDKIRVGFVGRITAKKGWSTFVRMADLIIRTRKDIQFILVGTGNEEKQLEALIKQLGLKSFIKCLDFQPPEQLAQIYNCFDLFIFPTEGESLGLVALEAMACGVPVIASNISAPKYYIEDGVNGYKFEVGNISKLSLAVYLYIDLPKEKKDEICSAAYTTGSRYYSKCILESLISIF